MSNDEIKHPEVPSAVLQKEADAHAALLTYIAECKRDPASESTEAAWLHYQKLRNRFIAELIKFNNSLREKEA